MIQTNSKDKFITYMKELLKSSNHDEIFNKYYNVDINIFLEDFKEHVKGGRKAIEDS